MMTIIKYILFSLFFVFSIATFFAVVEEKYKLAAACFLLAGVCEYLTLAL